MYLKLISISKLFKDLGYVVIFIRYVYFLQT